MRSFDFDFTPLFRSAVGFERMPSLLDTAWRLGESVDSYPPYNIEKTGENAYRISIAVAGFTPDDLEVEVKENMLVVRAKGRKEEEETGTSYLYRGIARRAFERRFQLADYVQVSGAALENGLLNVELVREIPEAHKPRRIKIASGTAAAHKTQLEGRKAA